MPIKKITLYVTIAALFLIPIFPLIVANSMFFPFITGKAFYFRGLVELAFASWLILAFLDPRYRPRITATTIGVTVFALVALIADLLGVNPVRSLWSNFERMEGWVTIIHLWAFYLVSTSIFGSGPEGRTWWQRWMIASLLCAALVAAYGLLQLTGVDAIHQGSSRLDASLGNSAYLAIYMLINAFFALYLYFARHTLQKKYSWTGWLYSILVMPVVFELLTLLSHQALFLSPIFLGVLFIAASAIALYFWRYQAVFILFSVIVFETQTRGTILGIVGGIMLALLIYAVFGRNESMRARQVSGGIVLGILVLIGAFWLLRHQPWIESNPILGRFSNISWEESSNQARQFIWPVAIKGGLERPLLGWGQENFNYLFNAYYNPQMWSQEQWFDRAHNVFLDWFVDSGFIGLFAYLALYVLFLRAVWKSSLGVAEKSVLTGLLAGYFVHNLFVFDNLASYVFFFAGLGFVNSLRKEIPVAEGAYMTKPLRLDAVEYIVAPIAIVALVAVFYFIEVRPIQANTRLIYALEACQSAPSVEWFQKSLDVNAYVANQEIREQLLSCSGSVISAQQIPGPTKQAFFTLAMQQIQAQVAATPKDARIYVLAGAFLNSIQQYTNAEPLLETGHKLSPGKQTLDFELATDYINTNQADKAVTLLKTAYESAPDFFQAENAYAIALVLDGKETEARTVTHNDPAIFQTQQMANVFASLKQWSKALEIYSALVAASPDDTNLIVQYAQVQYAAGQVGAFEATMHGLEKAHPDLKTQVEAFIKQVEAQPSH